MYGLSGAPPPHLARGGATSPKLSSLDASSSLPQQRSRASSDSSSPAASAASPRGVVQHRTFHPAVAASDDATLLLDTVGAGAPVVYCAAAAPWAPRSSGSRAEDDIAAARAYAVEADLLFGGGDYGGSSGGFAASSHSAADFGVLREASSVQASPQFRYRQVIEPHDLLIASPTSSATHRAASYSKAADFDGTHVVAGSLGFDDGDFGGRGAAALMDQSHYDVRPYDSDVAQAQWGHATADEIFTAERPAASSAGAAAAALPEPTRRIIALYAARAPEKLHNLHNVLDRYRGAEDVLLSVLMEKYHVTHEELSVMLESEADASADTSADERRGGGRNVTTHDRDQSPGLTPDEQAALQRRIWRLYERYAPDKLRNLDNVLAKYSGGEDILLEVLIKRYGPEPPA